MWLEMVSVIMIACENARTSNHVAFGIHERQNVTSLAFLPPLVGDRLAAFFRQGMGPIKVDVRQIQICLHGQNALMPHGLETAVVAPLGKVMKHRAITDFFFSEPGCVASGSSSH